jgi:hypothetical protein
MKLKMLSIPLLLSSFVAIAIPHDDCAEQFKLQFHDAIKVEKISFKEALTIVSSEGYLEGRALRSAQLELGRAKQIWIVYLEGEGGSATDLVTTERSCTIRRVIRVQEE